MAAVAALVPYIAGAATIGGTLISASGTLAGGAAANRGARYEAQQLEAKGKEELAAASVERDQLRRKKELALSTLQNRAAGSGFSATDPTSLALADEIAKYGTLQEQMALFGGESRKTGYEGQAAASRYRGKVAAMESRYKAAGTILGGISTLAGKYGGTPSGGETVIDDFVGPGGWRTTTRRASPFVFG